MGKGSKTSVDRGSDLRPVTYIGNSKVAGDAWDMHEYMDPKDYHSVWSSPEKFGRYIASQSENKAWCNAGWRKGEKDFFGTRNMQEAMDILNKGWKQGAEKVEKLRNRIIAQNPMGPRMVKYGMAGAVPSVPRAVAGNILNMKNPDNALTKKKPIITLMADMGASCNISPDTISNKAAVIAVLVDQIEAKGFSCEVVGTSLSKGYGSSKIGDRFNSAITVRVKESHQPADIARIAYAIGHASFFRRFVFADKGLEPICKDGLGHGLGYSGDFQRDKFMKDKNIFFLPSLQNVSEKFKTEELAATDGLDYLLYHLKGQGCPAFKDVEVKYKPKKSIYGDDF